MEGEAWRVKGEETVVKVPDGGRQTAFSQKLLETIKPQLAVVFAEQDDRYHDLAAAVEEAWKEQVGGRVASHRFGRDNELCQRRREDCCYRINGSAESQTVQYSTVQDKRFILEALAHEIANGLSMSRAASCRAACRAIAEIELLNGLDDLVVTQPGPSLRGILPGSHAHGASAG